MFKGIKNILKTMGEALTYSNVGEMLTKDQKSKILIDNKNSYSNNLDTTPSRIVLASDDVFSSNSIIRAISLCRKEKAILDLLCIKPDFHSKEIPIENVLTSLEVVSDVGYEIIRKQGEFTKTLKNYTTTRTDIIMIIVNINQYMRIQAVRSKITGTAFDLNILPAELLNVGVNI